MPEGKANMRNGKIKAKKTLTGWNNKPIQITLKI